MAVLTGHPIVQFPDNSGDPLSLGTVNTYKTGTTTNKATYPTKADADAATNANANPIVLDSAGRPDHASGALWLLSDELYTLLVKNSAGTTIYTVDDVGSDASAITYADGESIKDSNSNELIEFGVTASAINEIKITNAAAA